MASIAELEQGWSESGEAPQHVGSIRRLIVRLGDGRHAHPERVRVTAEDGVEGDRWAAADGDPEAQVSLMEHRSAALVADGGDIAGVGDNLLVDFDLSEAHLPVGARLRAGGAVLEVTPKLHLGCAKFRARFGADALAWVNDKETRPRRLRGLHTRVIEDGVIRVGDRIERLST